MPWSQRGGAWIPPDHKNASEWRCSSFFSCVGTLEELNLYHKHSNRNQNPKNISCVLLPISFSSFSNHQSIIFIPLRAPAPYTGHTCSIPAPSFSLQAICEIWSGTVRLKSRCNTILPNKYVLRAVQMAITIKNFVCEGKK
jgi:hypothetical protein